MSVEQPRDDQEAIVVYQSVDREGSTFALSPYSRRSLEERFGADVNLGSRIFIAHATKDAYERLHGSFGRQIVQLLTGLSEERLAELGRVEFRDPVKEQL